MPQVINTTASPFVATLGGSGTARGPAPSTPTAAPSPTRAPGFGDDGFERARPGRGERSGYTKPTKTASTLPNKPLLAPSDDIGFTQAGLMLANSFWTGTPFGRLPTARLDFDSSGKVEGWIDPVRSEPGRRIEINGNFSMSALIDQNQNPAPLSVRTSDGRTIEGRAFVYADRSVALELTLPGLGKNAPAPQRVVLTTTPSLPNASPAYRFVVAAPLYADNPGGAYGHPARMIFDTDGKVHGWKLEYNEEEDIHREPIKGTWSLNGNAVECTITNRSSGTRTLRGEVGDGKIHFAHAAETEGDRVFTNLSRVSDPYDFFDA
ncbi:MAG: hypothetical protein IPK13_16895 [Deltaproteobacteria bacterium]|nr:hypothetical protein [Deltaproteobacteria bacterium]